MYGKQAPDVIHACTCHIIPHFVAPFQLFHIFFKALQMVGGLEQHGVLWLLFRKLMAEAHRFRCSAWGG